MDFNGRTAAVVLQPEEETKKDDECNQALESLCSISENVSLERSASASKIIGVAQEGIRILAVGDDVKSNDDKEYVMQYALDDQG